jgi:predicted DNA-binding protein
MELHLTPELEARLNEMATKTGRAADELVKDAMAGYLEELAEVRGMLDRRYDEVKSGKVKPIDGEAFFQNLRERENELLKRRSTR